MPNGQDGVPGRDPGRGATRQEFVYRFRADQAGTYWYHTHAASDLGVRMGLYGVLVVRPRAGDRRWTSRCPCTRWPADRCPRREWSRSAPGAPVRLRLINTDSTTHRFALAGTPFRVAAVDGSTCAARALVDTAVLIPAGGRYDLVLTAGRAGGAVRRRPGGCSTGPVTAATGGWPELDPLGYGADRSGALVPGSTGVHPGPGPWAGLRRSPRVRPHRQRRGPPGIPTAVRPPRRPRAVHRGQPADGHPWHLHGHHVLVLARDGTGAGSPLWLDSFDVRPGEVWQVAFRADNPGIWMNHCHNLPHAEPGWRCISRTRDRAVGR